MNATTGLATAVLCGAMAVEPMVFAQKAPPQGRTIEITVDDTITWNVKTIEAKAGETLTVRIADKGTLPKIVMGHNFVLLKHDTNLTEFTRAAVTAWNSDNIPSKFKSQVIASTETAGSDENASVSVTFKVPVAGTYPYICSFPGHFPSEQGVLIVK
jgi:azurin